MFYNHFLKISQDLWWSRGKGCSSAVPCLAPNFVTQVQDLAWPCYMEVSFSVLRANHLLTMRAPCFLLFCPSVFGNWFWTIPKMVVLQRGVFWAKRHQTSTPLQWRIQRGAEGAYAPPPKIALRWGKSQVTFRNRSVSQELHIVQKWQTTF